MILCMGSRVVDRDPRPPLARGTCTHRKRGGGSGTTEDGRRSPLHRVVGGCVLTGAELNGVNELVRFLYDALKPKLYYAYDRHADAYLRTPS